jgi:hypothetical protein
MDRRIKSSAPDKRIELETLANIECEWHSDKIDLALERLAGWFHHA